MQRVTSTTIEDTTLFRISILSLHDALPILSSKQNWIADAAPSLHYSCKTVLCAPATTLSSATCTAKSAPCSTIAAISWKPHRPDRKSTRLNSSHVENSYAVFCLKKKRTVII